MKSASNSPNAVPSPRRPVFHFTPPRNWINDPNGLVYVDGLYHLFYQHNPNCIVWGDIHWGHATSHDLIHWVHQPLALFPDPDGLGITASGSAVVDRDNSSGFKDGPNPPVVAIFSHFTPDGRQVQSLAFSNDLGASWSMYAGNPVLADPTAADFRDPKVFWHEPSGHWVMVLAAGDHIRLYTSVDLHTWHHRQDFGLGLGAHEGVWECPDLIEVRAGEATKWVMLVSVQSGAPNGGSGTQYFIGRFDGTQFEVDPMPYPLWLDYGPDNYAAVTWSNAPGEAPIAVAWMSNWRYADRVPATLWRGSMTVPRVLSLRPIAGQWRLLSRPVDTLDALRGAPVSVPAHHRFALDDQAAEIVADVEWPHDRQPDFCLRLRSDGDDEVCLRYRPASGLTLDRTTAVGDTAPMAHSASAPTAAASADKARLRVLLDRTSVEVFVDDGLVSLTALVFPRRPLTRLTVEPGPSVNASTIVFPMSDGPRP